MSTADLVRALRERLGLTQEALAERAKTEHPTFDRVYLSKIESGANKATSAKIRDGLAAAFGLNRGDLEDYLSERISLDEAARRTRTARKSDPQVITHARFTAALAEAFRAGQYTVEDLDAARMVFRNGQDALTPEDDPVRVAAALLRCVAELRQDGNAITPEAVLVRLVRHLPANEASPPKVSRRAVG